MLYLRKIFGAYSGEVNSKQYLDVQGVERIFQPCNEIPPFEPKKCVNVGPHGLTYDQWVGLWHMAFMRDTKKAFRCLIYTGYVGRLADVIKPVQVKLKDIVKEVSQKYRNVFQVYVIGAARSGKTALLDTIL